MKGFKLHEQPSKKTQIKQLETELKNSQVANRMSQLMIQQLVNSVKSIGDDLNTAVSRLYELQYKYDALRQYLNADVNNLNDIANQLRLKDFQEAAERADLQEELQTVETATEDSTVVLTSTAKDENNVDKGIFRSRVKLSESGSPDLISKLLGKKVGDKVLVKLNNLDHTVELLSVKNGPTKADPETTH